MENKFDTGDLFTNEENRWGKTPPGNFKVTTLNNPLLSITSGYKYKESYQTLWPIPKYQRTVEPFTPISNWTYIIETIFQFNAQITVRD